MSTPHFFIRLCTNQSCRFRFPVRFTPSQSDLCPKCGAITQIIDYPNAGIDKRFQSHGDNGSQVDAMLDNIRSAFNVGSIFRTADGAGLHHLHLCGITPTPDNPKIAKTSLGAEYSVPWTYHPDSVSAAFLLKSMGYKLWALECKEDSSSLFDVVRDMPSSPILLIIGNEITGVDPGLLELCDQTLWIPMQGYKRSLNVAIAFGVAAYVLRFSCL